MQLTDERKEQLLESLAGRIEQMGMVAPSILFLEASKPFGFVGSQALLFLQPILGFFLDDKSTLEYALLFEHRENLESLITRLEKSS